MYNDTLSNYEWHQCSHCWGNTFILEPARNNEGYIPVPCTNCVGVGHTIELTTQGVTTCQ